MRKVVVVDYGFGNIPSVVAALREIGLDPYVDTHGESIRHADVIFLPGVASFGPAKQRLERSGQADRLRDANLQERWIVGLCLGAQLLLDGSHEAPGEPGFGFIPGEVARLNAALMTVPNQGWHKLRDSEYVHPSAGRPAIAVGAYVYFSHGYQIKLANGGNETSHIEVDGVCVTASYQIENILGFQFHPELSGESGLGLLRQLVTSLE